VLVQGGVMLVVLPAVYPSTDEMELDTDGTPLIWSAEYELPEFETQLREANFTVLDSGYRVSNGSMFFLAQK
jgi:hypothetical protein